MSEDQAGRKAQIKAQFNAIVADYDTGPGCFAHFGRRLVAVAGIEPGQRVLDVACGRGAVLFPAAEQIGQTGDIVGIDLAEEMARATNEEAARRGLQARVRVMDAEHLEFPDTAFDRVLCGFGIMFFPDQDRGLAQMRRVLKPGGRLAVSTWKTSQGGAAELKAVLEDLGHESGTPPGWITEPEVLEQLLARNGFNDIRVQIDSKDFRFADVDELWQVGRGTGLRRLLDKLDAEQKRHVLTAFDERVKPYRRNDGLHIPATALLAVATC